MTGLILWLLFGAIVGWLAGLIMKDSRGIIGNIIVGILGSALGGWLSTVTMGTNFKDFSIEGIAFAVVGAMILLFLKKLLVGKAG